jgi:hypothetical protein
MRVVDDAWVVLEEHLMPTAWTPIDAGGLRLLYLEAVLKDQGIDTAFDPFRPGEGGGFTRDCAQPVRLLVKELDLNRARALAAEAAAAPEPAMDADVEDEPLDSDAPSVEGDVATDTFDSWA